MLYILERDPRIFALIEWFGLYPFEQVDADHLRFPPYGLYAGEVLSRIQHSLARDGLGLLVHDAYRLWYVTKMFWDATPDSLRVFVADPFYPGGSSE